MVEQRAERIENLETAFKAFNEMSGELMSAYRDLENQVETLNHELVVVRDERLEQFEQIKSLANRLERLLAALPGGVVVLDGRGIVQEVNPAAIELLGEPLKKTAWREVISRAFEPRFDDGHDASLCDGRRVSISTSSLGDEPGQILLIKDVTETRELQDKLSRYQRLSSMGKMAASLAHQIRTPTTSALLYASNLSGHDVDSATANKYGEKIRTQLRHIETMIVDMLAFVKGGVQSEAFIFSSDELVLELTHALQVQAQLKECKLEFKNELPDHYFKGNKDALVGAFINVAMNALHACIKEKPRVIIRIERGHDNYALFSVEDNGVGIAAEIKDKIFEPFVTTRAQGTGLGLAIVKSVVERHQGEITVESEPGRGSKVVIALPIEPVTGASKELDSENRAINEEVLL